MKYIFDPVPPSRLGQSLGIDPVPLKTCNWNCVYYPLGRYKPVMDKRGDYYPPKEIVTQVQDVLASHKPGEINYVAFVSSGETTLYAIIGLLIRQVKTLTNLPVAVITNGSLLYLSDMCDELSTAAVQAAGGEMDKVNLVVINEEDCQVFLRKEHQHWRG